MPRASLTILNANVITLDPKQPRAEAIAIQNQKIIAVGTNAQMRKLTDKNTKLIDSKGKTITPGLVDCHIHMTSFGYSLQQLNLRNAESIQEMQQKLRAYAKQNPDSRWILGGRWDHEKFREKRYPTRQDLDAAVPDRPVFLRRVCGHIGVCNTKALELAGITKKTAVKGGRIDLDERSWEPNGIIRENAMDLVWKAVPKPTQRELEEACILACQNAAKAGLTGVHWLADSTHEIRTILKLSSEGKLPLRIHLGISVDLLDEIIKLDLPSDFRNGTVKMGFIKILADGSLGGHTAALKEPYSDRPETDGIMLYTQSMLNKLVSKAHKAGLQLAIHAIGDRAVEAVLEAYAKALREHPRRDHRHRVEHCSVLNPRLVGKMKQLGVVASVQPHFIASDFWIPERLGKRRARWAYPFKTLMKKGITVTSGSDCPVEPVSPLLGIWAATTRKDLAQEKLTAEEALGTYSLNAAFATFDEGKKGTIEAGKLADLTILSQDPTTVAPDKIRDTAVEAVIVDGKVVCGEL
jgi:predicted amidohydrolase YtcJ